MKESFSFHFSETVENSFIFDCTVSIEANFVYDEAIEFERIGKSYCGILKGAVTVFVWRD
jgi:hypothetical protein